MPTPTVKCIIGAALVPEHARPFRSAPVIVAGDEVDPTFARIDPPLLSVAGMRAWWFGARTPTGVLRDLGVTHPVFAARAFPEGALLIVRAEDPSLTAARTVWGLSLCAKAERDVARGDRTGAIRAARLVLALAEGRPVPRAQAVLALLEEAPSAPAPRD